MLDVVMDGDESSGDAVRSVNVVKSDGGVETITGGSEMARRLGTITRNNAEALEEMLVRTRLVAAARSGGARFVAMPYTPDFMDI